MERNHVNQESSMFSNYKQFDGEKTEKNLEIPRVHSGISYNSAESALERIVEQPANTGYISFPDQKSAAKETWYDILSLKQQSRRKAVVQGCYISLGAICGVLLRIIIAQLFGEACANPGTVGFLSAAAPLCVTKDGQTKQQGGIIFADLPSNLLGSFLMGLFQDHVVLGLAVPMAVAWLSPDSAFQKCTVLHTAFKTGFCGSLTTFSSWNSEMVVMIFGTDSTKSTQLWSSLFGYIIGMETSLGSFVCGCSVARRIHRHVNPTLAAERDASRVRKEEGVYINKDLPDFERRFLPNLDMGIEYSTELYQLGRIDSLERWRSSTEQIRRVRHPLLSVLNDIENAVLVLNRPVQGEAESVARAEGWEIDCLLDWVHAKTGDINRLPSVSSNRGSFFETKNIYEDYDVEPSESKWFKLPVASLLMAGTMFSLIVALLSMKHEDAFMETYRTMVYSMLFAPSGALLRWKLSSLNGTFPFEGWTWFPFGTFLANFIGSCVSIVCIALEYHLEKGFNVNSFWAIGSIRAVKIGFSGCLTTVSTFVAEVSGFMHSHTDHAYPYIFVTLSSCCTIAMILYGCIVYLI